MIVHIKAFFRDIPIVSAFIMALAFNGATWVALLRSVQPASTSIFLHYTVVAGVNLTGTWAELYAVPVVSLIVLICNGYCAYRWHGSYVALSRMIMGVSAFFSIGMWWGLRLILAFNG